MSIESITAQIAELSFEDKLRLNVDLAGMIKKEAKVKPAKGKSDAPKRKTAVGTMAWIEFVKHCKQTMPDRFADCTKEPERLSVCKAIKDEDTSAYEAFVSKFKADSEPPSEVASDEEKPAPKLSAAEKVAALNAKKEKEVKEKEVKEEKEKKEKKEKKEVKEVKEKKKEVKEVKKKEVKKKEEVEEELSMPKKEINGKVYFHDPETNGLYGVNEGDEFGPWVGFYQPGNKEPIRYTESPADE